MHWYCVSALPKGEDLSLRSWPPENGFITDTKVMSHSETPGLGSKVTEPDFKDQFNGLDESGLDGIVTISGATISSNHYIDTVRDALAAVEIAKEAE